MAKVAPPPPDAFAGRKGPRQAITVGMSPMAVEELSFTQLIRKRLRHALHIAGWYESPAAVRLRKFLHGWTFAMITGISLFIALFFGDLFVVLQVPTNTELDVILTLVLCIFVFEFVGLCLVDASYFMGFFFWMDLVGTASMLLDMSYIFSGNDATSPVSITTGQGGGNEDVIVVRAARAAKLGARAGRISRVLKIVRFLSRVRSGGEDVTNVRVAKVISHQLQNVLSTRVAFLTICIVVVMPLFGLLTYPEMDDSMSSWTTLLDRNAAEFYSAKRSNSNDTSLLFTRLESEASRLAEFYQNKDYGCFKICIGWMVNDEFMCDQDLKITQYYEEPKRKSSIRTVTETHAKAFFDLSSPLREEAASGMVLIIFIIVAMVVFGLIMSHSMSTVALRPLERMLAVVRERCAQIFKYTEEMNEDSDSDEESEAEDYDDWEQASEFAILEKVVARLAVIVDLTAASREPEIKENMTENEKMVLEWTQGNPQITKRHGMHSVHSTATPLLAPPPPGDWARSSMLSGIPLDVTDSIDSADFDSLRLSRETQIEVASWMVMTSEGSATWVRANVNENHLMKFVSCIESKYKPNPFHNFAHGVDVTYACYRFMKLTQADQYLSESSQFWLLIAAIAHDVGHIGVNNQFLVETSHELALKYNDRSPLENMHCSTLFQTVSEPGANVFTNMDKDLYKEMRKGMINAILHTDITKHNEMIKEMIMLYQCNSDACDGLKAADAIAGSQNNLQLVLNLMLHGADVGNPMKPWPLCEKLANLCIDEFFAQGDREKEMSIPVQMLNDRDKVNRPNSQIGFIEFLICPFAEAMVNIFPQLDSYATHLGSNIQQWLEVWQAETSPPPDAVAKVQARVSKVGNRCKAVTRDFRGIPC